MLDAQTQRLLEIAANELWMAHLRQTDAARSEANVATEANIARRMKTQRDAHLGAIIALGIFSAYHKELGALARQRGVPAGRIQELDRILTDWLNGHKP